MAVEAEMKQANVNLLGLEKTEYRGLETTLCQGCGHNSITSQIVTACFQLSIPPEKIVKVSGIGCSSKAAAYFLSRSHGFNGLHGRMPSVATGAVLSNPDLHAIGMSGDGDTANIGLGQFKHLVRRNVPMVYIVANNGVYGLTKGQFSATADQGLELKREGQNELPPIDICLEALVGGATFVARSFAGDPKQLSTLLKAALAHRGTAVLDVISPCVTFNNKDESPKSYAWGKAHEAPLHDITFIPYSPEMEIEYAPGELKRVSFDDGSVVWLKKVATDHDPGDRLAAIRLMDEARTEGHFVTGLIYVTTAQPTFVQISRMSETPLAHLPDDRLRPPPKTLDEINRKYT
ncbi:MAG: 2-oxoacid:ferredoxin oxidoreductase subunit beta [Anaerolineales bacterium]|jgi:2-oxoglutarate ferredoxin oxidoreductase subunit beta